MPIQVFADESGGKGHGRYFVMAALSAPAESWLAFTDEWRACLAEHPRIHVFKMREAAKLTGQFFGWKPELRDRKLEQLAKIINKHAQVAFYSVIDLDAHARTWALALPKPMDDPYFYPFHNTILAACLHLWDAGHREKIEMIFDENLVFGLRAKQWYPMMREVLRFSEPEAYNLSPSDPLFRTDDEFLPLQASDLYAWCIRNGTSNPSDTEFSWLLGHLQNVHNSEYSQLYDAERMASVLELRDSKEPDAAELLAAYKRAYGEDSVPRTFFRKKGKRA